MSQGANGTVAIDDKGTADTTDDTVSYTPDGAFEGEDSFTYTISDGEGGSDTATVTVSVQKPLTPVVSISADTTTLVESEGDSVTFTFNVENLPADGVRVSVGTFRPGDTELLIGGIADFNAFAGAVNGIEAFGGFNGNSGFTFNIVEDGATFTVPIFDDADIPPGTSGQTRNDDVGVEQTEWRLIDFSNANPPFNEVDDFVIADGAGSVVLTLKDTPDQTYEAGDDVATTSERRPVSIDVLANDNSGVEIVALEDPTTSFFGVLQNGEVEIDDQGTTDTSDDTVIYRPDSGFVGTDAFTYLVRNAEGELDQALVTVEVGPLENTLPNAMDDAFTTAFNTPIEIDVLSLLANDSDADGDDFFFQGDRLGTPVPSGMVTFDFGEEDDPTDDVVTFTPADGFSGDATFDYIIRDAFGGEDTATVTVTVEPPVMNTDPIANDDTASTAFETPISIDVLGNDSDPDEDPLTLTEVGSAENGSVDIVDGEAVYTPDDGFEGDDAFSYTISDGRGGSDTATVSVTVGDAPNLPPVAVDDDLTE
ncbi:MAG: Ig-like domain-containing protein, partial [Actinomycetota bacterium]